MTLAITINLILSAIVFTAIVGFLAAAIRPAGRIKHSHASSRSPSNRPLARIRGNLQDRARLLEVTHDSSR